MVERDDLAQVAHVLESCLERLRSEKIAPGRAIIDAALLAVDVIGSGLEQRLSNEASQRAIQALQKVTGSNETSAATALDPEIKPAKPEPAEVPSDGPASIAAEGWVRMPVKLLDSILYRLDELVALDANLQRRRLEPIRRELTQEVHVLGLLAQALQDEVKEVRMVPAGPTLDPLRRVVRETAFSLGKEAALDTRGEDVRVDKRHLDMMREPLMHLVRNAVDHGLESPDERRAAGKPARGKVEILVDARDSDLCIEVRDDGRGINRSKLLAAAVERGLVDSKRAAELTDREVLNLIFLPGFSTSNRVTELSGRGVGLDVVRESVERLGGRIDSYSDPGRGTQFKLILPLTVASSRGLMVWAGKEAYCLPLMLVDEVVAIDPSAVGVARGQLAIQWRHQAVTFVSLSDLLAHRPSERPNSHCFAVVLALADRRLAIGVDEVLGEEEIVVKGLAPGTPKLPFVAGATNRADGRLVTVLELAALAKAAASSSHQPMGIRAAAETAATILVVDDALTTRTMISLVLEQSGYRTLVASNGEEALAVLDAEHVDILVADVEMPVLNGLELVQRVRASSRHSALPVILLTSLDSPVDRARGAEVGANSYVLKNAFEPASFLSMVSDFVGRRGAA
jgi:two-component system chemotaxis sensor kinase CheA